MKSAAPNKSLASLKSRWRAQWSTLAAREQNMVLAACAALALALVWWVALAPALHSLRTAASREAQAEHELQQMQRLQREAEQLRAQPQPVIADARQLLQASLTEELGATAQLNWLGTRAQVSFKAASAPALARWLAQVRGNTHAMPVELKLQASTAEGAPEKAASRGNTRYWDGSLLLDWPGDGQARP